MPFVKISDPNIIDLAAWHQVINVVNQHTDSINAITNSFGVQGSGTVDWNSDNNIAHEFTSGPQKMLYGREKIENPGASYINNKQIFYGDISFIDGTAGTTAFSAKPIITATVQFGHQTISSLDDKNHNPIVTIFGVTESQFSFRITRATSTSEKPVPLTAGNYYLNWHAIGPK